ncbi:hypothetical protein ZOSMA_173G00030 [Zostera marina]|uniref:Uncharacterized protein n=1 Tax=Zostera marina TaxID=29655 RepID=A0A0K9PS10_ZOSMR|nr:hypothetical protein ZOSMA_173G00030 [Zostera marina]
MWDEKYDSNGSDVKLESIFSMKGGNEESSYAKNSQAQAAHVKATLHLLKDAIDNMSLSAPKSNTLPFTVADLGCSCGTNTFFLMDYIINNISKRYEVGDSEKPPEFQAFFSDLPSNDFNTLFKLMSCSDNAEMRTPTPYCSYYAAGVPGSFHHRLFPSRSIDVFSSIFSLHWLSKLPKTIREAGMEGYNKGKISAHGASEATAEAYRKQFESDLGRFLQCRAEEMKTDGIMFLVLLGRESLDPTDQGTTALMFANHFQGAWDDLVKEGLLEAERRDEFNLPIYSPNLEEFRNLVEANSHFAINKLELVACGSPLVIDCKEDADEVGRVLMNICRSCVEVLVEAHIGKSLSNELFKRMKNRATSDANELVEHMQFSHIVASLSFTN